MRALIGDSSRHSFSKRVVSFVHILPEKPAVKEIFTLESYFSVVLLTDKYLDATKGKTLFEASTETSLLIWLAVRSFFDFYALIKPCQPAITCSKLKIKTLQQGVKYV